MSFISPTFLIFLPAALIVYFLTPSRFRWCVLLPASFVFYWFVGGVRGLASITFTILTVYASGRWAGALRQKKAARALRRLPLAICLVLNFGLLAFMKFGGALASGLGLLLIPGISFYTFQAAGYLTDIYTGKVTPERNLFRTALFLSFFPQLIQGPISRHSEIANDLFAGHGWDWERSRSGAQRILWGYFTKLIVADYAAPVVGSVFENYREHGGALIVFAVILYSIQIYADFSGGINIALGVAKIIGVKLPENFRQPFFATSLADFWRRWHITLGSWLKDYLFYPLSLSAPLGKLGKFTRKVFGKRTGKMLPSIIATFCVYLVVGVWHGSSWNLIVFGLLNGVMISTSLLIDPWIEKIRNKTGIIGTKSGVCRVFSALRTLAFLVFLRYFVRAESLWTALSMFKQSLYNPVIKELWSRTLLNLGLNTMGWCVLGFGIVVLFVRDFLTERGIDCGEMLNRSKPVIQYLVLIVAVISITFFGIYSEQALSASFIYAGY